MWRCFLHTSLNKLLIDAADSSAKKHEQVYEVKRKSKYAKIRTHLQHTELTNNAVVALTLIIAQKIYPKLSLKNICLVF